MNRNIIFSALLCFIIILFIADKILWSKTSVKPRSLNSMEILDVIRRDCGALCNTLRSGSNGLFFNYVEAPIDCKALFNNEYIDRGHGFQNAPKEIPQEMLNDFTMNNRVGVKTFYFNQPYLNKKARTPLWSIEMIKQYISSAERGELRGTYGVSETNALRRALQHAPRIKNGRVLVIGTEIPWVEACALEAGAREVVTLEYGKIVSEHPKVSTMTPHDFRLRYLNNTLGRFDAIITFSSIEHSGLGRYGDALNPWGDIIAVAKAWCVTKLGGSLTISVPYNYNQDSIRFNAHRVYGKIRYPFLTSNWKQVYKGSEKQIDHGYGGPQTVFVFRK